MEAGTCDARIGISVRLVLVLQLLRTTTFALLFRRSDLHPNCERQDHYEQSDAENADVRQCRREPTR